MSSVLFDVPGPRARRRNAIVGLVSVLALLALFGWIFWVLWDNDQFTERRLSFAWNDAILQNLAEGLLIDLQAAATAILAALVYGFVFAVGRLSDHWWIRWPCWIWVEFFRAVPVLLLMLLLFYAFGDTISRYWCVVGALMLYNGSVLAEILRAGILSVPKGQSEAAYATGMRKNQVMRLILIPQSVTAMLPAIISQCVVALKDTTLGLILGFGDIISVARRIYTNFFFNNAIAVGLFLAVVFIIINYSLGKLAEYLERRYSKRGKQVVHLEELEAPGARGGAL
jgi:glutamate transport system permease protein